MIIITLHFNAVLMKLWESSLYHSSLLVKLTLNSILGALLYDLKRKVELTAQVIFRRLQMPACESKVLSAKRTLLLMPFHSESGHHVLITMRCAKQSRPINSVLDEDYLQEVEMLRPGTKIPHPTTVQ